MTEQQETFFSPERSGDGLLKKQNCSRYQTDLSSDGFWSVHCSSSPSSQYTQIVLSYSRQQRLVLALVPPVAALVIRLLGSTLRYRDIVDPETVPGDLLPRPVIFVFWHRSLLACAHRFRGQGIAILISQSFDGELIARTVERLGFVAVRGSSSKAGASGLSKLTRAYQAGLLCAITADGPRGPAMVAKSGASQLAALVGISSVGAFYALPLRAWVLRSWDSFLIPKPFSEILIAWPQHSTADLSSIQASLDRAIAMVAQCAKRRSPRL